MTQEQYRAMMAATARHQAQQIKQQSGVNGAQTDGAGDDEVEADAFCIVKQVGEGGEVMGRVEIDGLIRSKIEAKGKIMEGGGLMLPLREASTSSFRRAQKSSRQRSQSSNLATVTNKGKDRASALVQTDGPGDPDDDDDVKEEELDEDAINSDLDDPDDGLNEEEDEDEGMGHIMLCMYDKVQRVKNKWYVTPNPNHYRCFSVFSHTLIPRIDLYFQNFPFIL